MKYDIGDQDAAVRLKQKLRSVVDSLCCKESPALVKHMIHDVAHLASASGQRALRQQYQDIIDLANYTHSTSRHDRTDRCSEPTCDDVDGDFCSSHRSDPDTDSFHDANRDLLSKMSQMKDMIVQMEEQHSTEVESLKMELARYKELLAESDRKLIKERLSHQKQLQSSRSTHGNFGFGALTVRSCGSRNTSRSRCSPCPTCRHYFPTPSSLLYLSIPNASKLSN